MPEFTLTRTGDAPMQFTGELIAEASSYEQGGALNSRSHAIEVFRLADGWLVASVTFTSCWQGEHAHNTVQVCASGDALRDFLRCYDWHTGWQGYPTEPHYAERQARVNQAIAGGYARAVSEVLADFPESLT